MLLDLHTHHPAPPSPGLYQVQSLRPSEVEDALVSSSLYRSVGLHPWYPEELSTAGLLRLEQALHDPQVIALGESGLDKCCATPLALQIEYLSLQSELAEALSLPLILHLVRAWDELLQLKKHLRPKTPWIIHGFRGKGEQALQLLGQGLYLSFGAHAHSDALQQAFDAGRLFLETDDQASPTIESIYQLTAQHLGTSLDKLTERIQRTQGEVLPLLSDSIAIR